MRVITPRNVVLGFLILFFLGLVWLIFHCSKKAGKDAFQEQVNSVNIQYMKERELSLKKQEKNIKNIMKLLGVKHTSNYETGNVPTIYIVTPTHTRLTQKAEITRMYHTLLHVPQLHWIVVEDSEQKTPLISRFLKDCIIPHTHLNVRTRNELIRGKGEPRWLKNRGVEQRNLAIQWIRDHSPAHQDAVVYFADDDNTYDLRIFEMMRYTKKVSVWPVGIVGALVWEGPICKNGKVIKFRTSFAPERPLPVDMAGFAINVQMLKDNPEAQMDVYAKRGYVESSIVGQLVTTEELEALADNCRKILVWHTQTVTPKIKRERGAKKKYYGIEPDMEV